MLVICLRVSHRVGSTLCYWIMNEKENVPSHTIVQHLTSDETRDLNIQQQIGDHHVSLEAALGSNNFGASLDKYDEFIPGNEEAVVKGYPNEEDYQGLPDYPELDDVIENRNK